MTAKGFDTEQSFMVVEIDGDVLRFQTISRHGKRVDSGEIRHGRRVHDRRPVRDSTAARSQRCTVDLPGVMDNFQEELLASSIRLPLAALLGAVLALRPRRGGTPERQPAVVQTQIILAVVGSLIMLVVGASLARAFGIVGAANLIRYRSKIDDPKDAVVMLCALSVGLAVRRRPLRAGRHRHAVHHRCASGSSKASNRRRASSS